LDHELFREGEGRLDLGILLLTVAAVAAVIAVIVIIVVIAIKLGSDTFHDHIMIIDPGPHGLKEGLASRVDAFYFGAIPIPVLDGKGVEGGSFNPF